MKKLVTLRCKTQARARKKLMGCLTMTKKIKIHLRPSQSRSHVRPPLRWGDLPAEAEVVGDDGLVVDHAWRRRTTVRDATHPPTQQHLAEEVAGEDVVLAVDAGPNAAVLHTSHRFL